MGKYSDRLMTTEPAAPATPTQRLTAPAPAAPAPAAQTPPSVDQRIADVTKQNEGQLIKFGSGMQKAAEGVYQLTLDMAEGMDILPKGTASDWTRMTNEERALVNKEFKKEFGDGYGFQVAEATGELLPVLAVPAMGSTAPARIGGAMLSGAATGAAQYQADEDKGKRTSDRTMQAAVGGAVGGAVGVGLEGLHALKNIIPKAIESVKKLKGDFLAEGVDVEKRTGILFKLSQVTGDDPVIENLERLARESTGGERMARQIEDAQPAQALRYFESITSNEGRNFGARVERKFQQVMGDINSGTGLLGKRKVQADADFKLAEAEGGKIYLKNTLTKLNQLIQEFDVPGAGGTATQLVKELRDMHASLMTGSTNALDAIAASNSRFSSAQGGTGGALTPMQLQKNLERWGEAAKGTNKLFTDAVDRASEKGPAKALFSALNRDLDEAIKEGGQGALALRKARDNYAKMTRDITQVRETMLGKLFGGSETPTIEAIETKFMQMAPSEIKATMRVLNQADPRAEQALQSFWLRRQIESARIPGQAGSTEFVPAKLLDMISGGRGPQKSVTNREVFDAVFTSKEMKEQVMLGLNAVQRIMVNNTRTSGRTVSRLRNLAHVLATRDIGFASRLTTELLAPGMVTKYLMDPAGVKALSTLAQPYNDARAAAALMQLGNIAMRGMEAQQAPQEEHTVTATPLQ
jgi:hypothetical protein